MPPKCERSGSTLIAKPWSVTQRFIRTPSAPIFFSSAPSPTQMPMRLSAVRINAELRQRVDHPLFERVNEAADVLSALLEVEHDVTDALPGAVIGIASAAARIEHRKVQRVGELGGSALVPAVNSGCSSSQTHSRSDPRGSRRRVLHEGERLLVGHEPVADPPFDVRSQFHRAGRWSRRGCGASAVARWGDACISARASSGSCHGPIVDFEGVDETRDVLAKDGRLMASVALALVLLPQVIADVLVPAPNLSGEQQPSWTPT